MFEFGNEVLGIAFVALAAGLTFLMYYLWGFPYDKQTQRSQAPRALVTVHRLFGYVFIAIYVYLMWDMVPRLWTYQVELPARTVAHLLLGMAIGSILIIKVVIVRFFKHLEARLAPALGTSLLVCTLLLLGLALPTTFREAFLRDSALMGGSMNSERLARVREQLPKAGIEDPALLGELASVSGLYEGRRAMMSKCVQCHDLRTILARPRTPEEWRRTVERMANRSSVVNSISEDEQLKVTAYLVAISPTLQRTTRQQLEEAMAAAKSRQALDKARSPVDASDTVAPSVDLEAARAVFETKCSQCHSPVLVQAKPPADEASAVALVSRMVRNGLRASDEELRQIIAYLSATYGTAPAANTTAAVGGAQPVNPDADEPVSSEAGKPAPTSAGGGATSSSESPPAEPVGQTVTLQPAGTELRFQTQNIEIESGQRVRITLDNPSATGQIHNFVLVKNEDAYDEVSSAALAAPERGFAPAHEQVIASIPALAAGGSASVDLNAPAPGRYRFGCMMPGHSFTMHGTLTVR